VTPHTVIPWDGVAYCTNGDGNPATVELPSGMAGDHPTSSAGRVARRSAPSTPALSS
jgi:hypothetical protein